jgi:hypothetical protein
MGGSESKTVVKSLSESISNIAMSTVQSCETVADQTQDLNVNNTGIRFWGTYKLDQKTEIRSDCFSDVAKQADLQTKIVNLITQSATSQNVALLGAFGKSNAEASSTLKNVIKNNVNMSNIQKSYNAIKQKQTANFTNSGVIGFEQVELTQGAKIFAAATLQEVDKAGVFNAIENHIDQTSSAKMENPLDFIAKAIGAVGDTVMSSIFFFVFIIVGAVIGFVLLLKLLSSIGGSDGGGDDDDKKEMTAALLSKIPGPAPSSGVANLASGIAASGALSKIPAPPPVKAALVAAGPVMKV